MVVLVRDAEGTVRNSEYLDCRYWTSISNVLPVCKLRDLRSSHCAVTLVSEVRRELILGKFAYNERNEVYDQRRLVYRISHLGSLVAFPQAKPDAAGAEGGSGVDEMLDGMVRRLRR